MKSRAIKLTALAMTACMLFSSAGVADATTKEEVSAKTEQGTQSLAAQIHEALALTGRKASVKITNIPATEVIGSKYGYTSVSYKKEYKVDKPTDGKTTSSRSQTALVNKEGEIVIPYLFGEAKYYTVSDNMISFAQDNIGYGFEGTRTYEGEDYASRYYDLDLNELFSVEGAGPGAFFTGDTASSTTQIYDAKGNVKYEIPADLQKASIWKEEEEIAPDVKGFAGCKLHVDYKVTSLGLSGEGLTAFGSVIPMEDSLALPDLKGSKWDTEKGIDYLGYFRENAIKDGKLYGYVDASGKIVIPQSFSACGGFSEGLAWVGAPEDLELTSDYKAGHVLGLYDQKSIKCGFIDKTGKVVIPYEYDNVFPFEGGYSAVEKDGKCGYIDKQNNVVIPIEYDDTWGGAPGGLFAVGKGGKFGLVDKENKVVLPLIFDDISGERDGIVSAVYNGKLVIINMNEDSSSDWDKSGVKAGALKQLIKVTTSQKTIKASKLKKKARKFKLAGSARTTITYKKKSGKKGIKVSSNGVVTVKKGLKKKTYKITVSATAKDDGLFKSVSTVKTIKIKVK